VSLLQQYMRAMLSGNTNACIRIEQDHNLFGLPPEMVSTALKAIDAGEDVEAAFLKEYGVVP
jgi:hypothetical protein